MLLKLNDNPRLKAILKEAFPGYRKRSVSVHLYDKVTLSGGFWDEGSRNEWQGLNLATRLPFHVSYPTNPPGFSGGDDIPTFELGNRKAIIECGFSCGKPSTMGIYLTEQDWEAIK